MTWQLLPQLDNNGKEAGIAGLRIGWLTDGHVRCMVDWEHGEKLRDYLNGVGANSAGSDSTISQPYMDMERIPQSVGYP